MVPFTIVNESVTPRSDSWFEVEKFAPVTVTCPPPRGRNEGETLLMTGTNGSVLTGLPCHSKLLEVVPANATTTEKL